MSWKDKFGLNTRGGGLNWFIRACFFAFGVLTILMGRSWLSHGPWPGQNAYGQTVFPEGMIVGGGLFCCLAFLPPSKWLYRHLTTKRRYNLHKKD